MSRFISYGACSVIALGICYVMGGLPMLIGGVLGVVLGYTIISIDYKRRH